MTAPILVTGGTGTLGRLVVARLVDAGHDVRVLSRSAHPDRGRIEVVTGDLATGAGIDLAVKGAQTVLHLAGSPRGDEVKTQHLVDAAAAADVRHLVFISVVGAGRVPIAGAWDRALFGYFASKFAAERIVAGSGLPWTMLRATQFHDLVLKTAEQLTKLPLIPVFRGFRFQPVDAGEVADRLAELTLGEPKGLVADVGGPRVYPMDELIRTYLHAQHRRGRILPLSLPGEAARAFRAGANLAPDRRVGRKTWEDFLAERLASGGSDPTGSSGDRKAELLERHAIARPV